MHRSLSVFREDSYIYRRFAFLNYDSATINTIDFYDYKVESNCN